MKSGFEVLFFILILELVFFMLGITFKTPLGVLCEWSVSSPRGNISSVVVKSEPECLSCFLVVNYIDKLCNRFRQKVFFQVIIPRGYAGQILYRQPVSLSQVTK